MSRRSIGTVSSVRPHEHDVEEGIAPWDGRRVPMTLLGGYLGSGKTTILNALLRTTDRPLAVLVNDVGEINIDTRLLRKRAGDTLELTGGCVCCSLREGLGAALTYMEQVGSENIFRHEADLAAYAAERLSAINSLKLFGTAPDKGAIFSFEIEGAHAHDISMIIDREGIAVRAGTHCAQPLLSRYGVTSTCRASFGMYNTRDEIDALADALVKAHTFFA